MEPLVNDALEDYDVAAQDLLAATYDTFEDAARRLASEILRIIENASGMDGQSPTRLPPLIRRWAVPAIFHPQYPRSAAPSRVR